MELTKQDDYVYTRFLDLDTQQQKFNAMLMYDFIMNTFVPPELELTPNVTLLSQVFAQYNYLMYPIPGMTKLYENIKETFHYINRKENYGMPLFDEYHIQCWLNVYEKDKGNHIKWHGHWPTDCYSWHGFYCVNVEPESETIYRVEGRKVPEDDIHIASKNNLLVISPSGKDVHRTSEWHFDEPRITVAFDIVPTEILFRKEYNLIDKNHWIPI